MSATGYGHSVIGSREKNQDSFLIENEKGFYAVADGVGGGLHGEVASRMAVEGFSAHAPQTGSLKPVVTKLQEEVLAFAMKEIGEALMGTTLTAIRIGADNKVSLAHVGDSHLYVFSDGLLRVMTEDHEAFDETLQAPVLASYLGIPSDIHPLTIQEDTFHVKPGDALLLCSDGLYRQMTEQRLIAILKEGHEPAALLQKLCDEASKAEYSDNVTVVYVVIS